MVILDYRAGHGDAKSCISGILFSIYIVPENDLDVNTTYLKIGEKPSKANDGQDVEICANVEISVHQNLVVLLSMIS